MKRWASAATVLMIACNNEVVSLAVLVIASIAGFYCLLKKVEEEK